MRKKIFLFLVWIVGSNLANWQSLAIANNNLLSAQLDSIYTKDQKYRQMINDVESKHGYE